MPLKTKVLTEFCTHSNLSVFSAPRLTTSVFSAPRLATYQTVLSAPQLSISTQVFSAPQLTISIQVQLHRQRGLLLLASIIVKNHIRFSLITYLPAEHNFAHI